MLCFKLCKMRRLLALASVCLASSAGAQQRMTADEAVALALSQPHVRDELAAGVAIARSEVLAARAWSNPQLELSQERSDRGPARDDAVETGVLLSQTFELGGRRGLRVDAAELGVRAARLAADYELARLRAGVLRTYFDAAAAERLQAAQARAAAGLQQLAQVAGRRHRSGDLSGYESRRIAQAGLQAQAHADQAAVAAATARARLAGLVGDKALTAELDPDPALPIIPPLEDATQSAELDALQARREYAAAQARAEARPALPFNVGVGSRRVEGGAFDDSVMVLELGVPLPVFDRNQAARERAGAESAQADAQYQRALLQTRSRRAAALAQARGLSASARTLLDSAVPEAAQLSAIAQSSFAEGELDLVGLLAAHEAEIDVTRQAMEQQSRALDALLELQLLAPYPSPGTNP